MFPLGGRLAVFGSDGPFVDGVDVALADAGVDHWFDGEDHAGRHGDVDTVFVVGNFGRFVKGDADSVADELVDHRTFMGSCVFFDRIADMIDRNAWFADRDRAAKAFVGNIDDPFFFLGNFPYGDHFAAIAEVAVHDRGDVDIQDISFLKRAVIRDAVADHFVEGGADRFRIRGSPIPKVGGDRMRFVMKPDREAVQIVCRYARLRRFAEFAEDFGRDAASLSDFFDLVRRFENDPVVVQVFFGDRLRACFRIVAFFPFQAAFAPAGVIPFDHATILSQIVHSVKDKSVRRSGNARPRPILGRENGRNRSGREFPAADVKERAGDVSHHFV